VSAPAVGQTFAVVVAGTTEVLAGAAVLGAEAVVDDEPARSDELSSRMNTNQPPKTSSATATSTATNFTTGFATGFTSRR
jgi:hypothetical protein